MLSVEQFLKSVDGVKSYYRRNGCLPDNIYVDEQIISIGAFNDIYVRYCRYTNLYENIPVKISLLGKKDTPTLYNEINNPELSIYSALQSVLTSKYCYVPQTLIEFTYQSESIEKTIQMVNREKNMNINVKKYEYDPRIIRKAHNNNNIVLYNYNTSLIDEWVTIHNMWGTSEKTTENGLNIILNDPVIGELVVPIGLFKSSIINKIYVFEGI
jgi:hypothetical protein